MAGVRLALFACCLAVVINGCAARSGRDLLQSAVSCPAQIPGCTARRCTARILDSKQTYVCLRCLKGYIPVKGSDGKSVVQCVCPPGTSEVANPITKARSCDPCPQGSYCPGGNPKARKPTDNIGGDRKDCNPANTTGLTTKSTRSSRATDCVAEAGYVLPTSIGQPARQCTGSTYAPANNRLKSCLPCQSGLKAPDNFTDARANRMDVCQVPPGRFWELNVVRDCPKGLYRPNFVRTDDKLAISCTNCPEGWTTAMIGSQTVNACNVLLPGYKITDLPPGTADLPPGSISPQDGTFVPGDTEFCPIGYYNDGTALGCIKCPYSATTLKNGSTSSDDCVVPPGYFASSTTGQLELCPTTPDGTTTEGFYRPGWKNYKEVIDTDGTTVCIKCGAGILSTPRDGDEHPLAAAGDLVPATTASCYIKSGWGITFDPEDFTKYRAIVPCPANTYGVADTTYSLINAPCKACTKNLYSLEGSNSFDDCKNPGGFGYTSEGAIQCPDGFWAAKDSMAPCQQCPEGRTTLYQPGNGTLQDSIDDCFVVEGNGVFDGNSTDPWNPTDPDNSTPAKPCPVGYYTSQETLASSPKCQQCADQTTTTAPGSTTCDACVAGYGKADSTSSCTTCPYGKFSYGTGDSCSTCPSTTFNDFVGDGYTSYGITVRTGMKGEESCVPRYAQVPKSVGDRMGLPDAMLTTYAAEGADANAKVKSCIEACPADKCCIAEMEKPEDGDFTCKHAKLTPVAATGNGAKMFYKLPPSQFAGASIDDDESALEAKTIASGIYAICDITDFEADAQNGLIGTSNDPTKVEAGREFIDFTQCTDVASCKAACDKDATCWGFVEVPGSGFALRGGESWLGGRTFFVSPHGSQDFDLNSLKW